MEGEEARFCEGGRGGCLGEGGGMVVRDGELRSWVSE